MKLQGKTKEELIKSRFEILELVMFAHYNNALDELIVEHTREIPFGNLTSNQILKLVSTMKKEWIFVGFDNKEDVYFITLPFSASKEDILQIANSFGKSFKTCVYINPL